MKIVECSICGTSCYAKDTVEIGKYKEVCPLCVEDEKFCKDCGNLLSFGDDELCSDCDKNT